MKKNIKIQLLAAISFLLAANETSAQSTGATNTYNAANFLGWGATSGDLPFKVNNSTKMTLQNTTGYFGIGTTNPLGTLDVVGAVNAPSWTYLRGNTSGTKPSTSFTNGIGIGFNYSDAEGEVDFMSSKVYDWGGGAGGFRFQQWNENTAAVTELVVIQGSNGNTGIGTLAPASKLDVEGGVSIGASYSGTTAAPTNGAIIQGNVGIGTNSPTSNLHVNSSTGTTALVQTSGSDGNNISFQLAGASNANWSISTNSSSLHGAVDALAFRKNAGTSGDKMVILDNGNVGMGTTSPATGLHVKGVYPNGYFTVERTSVNGATHAGVMTINSDARTTGDGIVCGFGALNASSVAKQYAQIRMEISDPTASSEDGILQFWTMNAGTIAEKMRLTNAGNLGIGTTAPAYQLELSTNSAGKPTSSAWTVSSDARLKKDVQPFTDGLNVLQKINPVWFTYNGQGGTPLDEKGVGTIAQQLQPICPYMIKPFSRINVDSATNSTTEETYLGVDYGAMDFILVNSIKEQQSTIDSLKQQQKTTDSLRSAQNTKDSLLTIAINSMKVHQLEVDSLVNLLNKKDSILSLALNDLMAAVANCCSQQSNPKMMQGNGEQQQETTLQITLDDNEVILFQNQPNPFDVNTTIRYFIPENATGAAFIIFNDVYGQEIRKVEITMKGFGSINANTENLSSGIYTYSLYIDGKVIDTKKMIRNK